MSNIDSIVEKILAAGGESASLDDLMDETAAVMVSNINSEGLESQVRFLLEQGIPEESILAEVKG